MDRFLVRKDDRKQHRVKQTKLKKYKQSSIFSCKKVVRLESINELKIELEELSLGILIDPSAADDEKGPDDDDNDDATTAARGAPSDEDDPIESPPYDDDHRSVAMKRVRAIFDELSSAFIALETLEATKIGKIVNKWASKKRNVQHEDVRQQAADLVNKWKQTVREKKQLRKRRKKVFEAPSSSSARHRGTVVSSRDRRAFKDGNMSSCNFLGYKSPPRDRKRRHSEFVPPTNVSTTSKPTQEQLARARHNREIALQRLTEKKRRRR